MATYLVTGTAGFIGSNFVHYLVSDVPGAEVVALDNLGFAANLANLDPVRDRIRFVAAGLAETVDWYVANEAWWQDILHRKGDLQVAWATAR